MRWGGRYTYDDPMGPGSASASLVVVYFSHISAVLFMRPGRSKDASLFPPRDHLIIPEFWRRSRIYWLHQSISQGTFRRVVVWTSDIIIITLGNHLARMLDPAENRSANLFPEDEWNVSDGVCGFVLYMECHLS